MRVALPVAGEYAVTKQRTTERGLLMSGPMALAAYRGKKLGKSFHVDHVEPMMRHLPGADERSKISAKLARQSPPL